MSGGDQQRGHAGQHPRDGNGPAVSGGDQQPSREQRHCRDGNGPSMTGTDQRQGHVGEQLPTGRGPAMAESSSRPDAAHPWLKPTKCWIGPLDTPASAAARR